MRFTFTIKEPNRGERTQQFSDETLWIGRDPATCVLNFDDKRVSRRHARIEWVNGVHKLFDCGSQHGTWLNGEKLEPEHGAKLEDGNEILIGPYSLTYRFTPAGRDLDKTQENELTPKQLVDEIEPRLKIMFARELGKAPEERAKSLRCEIEAALARAKSDEERIGVLADLGKKFKTHGGPADKADKTSVDDTALVEGQRGIAKIAAKLIGEPALASGPEVRSFAMRIETILPVFVEKIMELIKVRRETREAFSIDTTKASLTGMNPVKECQSAADLARILFHPTQFEVHVATDALRHAFTDMSKHMIDLKQGVEGMVDEYKRRFSVADIEASVAPAGVGLGRIFGKSNVSACWEEFKKRCAIFERESDMYHPFRRAYLGSDPLNPSKPSKAQGDHPPA